jgi:hypothetical protein
MAQMVIKFFSNPNIVWGKVEMAFTFQCRVIGLAHPIYFDLPHPIDNKKTVYILS